MLRSLVFTHLAFALQGRGNLLSSALLCIAEARVGLKSKNRRTQQGCVRQDKKKFFFSCSRSLLFSLRKVKTKKSEVASQPRSAKSRALALPASQVFIFFYKNKN